MTRRAWPLLAPPLVWLGVFAFAPLVFVLLLAFAQRGRPFETEFSAAAWGRLLDPAWLTAFRRSAVLATATTAICLLCGAPLAVFIARRPPRLRRALYLAVVLPLWANSLALTYAWMFVLRPSGFLDQVAQGLGLLAPRDTFALLGTPGAVLVGTVYAYLPFMVYAVYTSAERLDWRLVDAAEDLGATRATALRRVVLPLLRPGLLAGSILVFVPVLGAFVVPDLLGGAKTAYLGNVLRDCFQHEPSDWPLGCVLSVVLLLLVAGALRLLARLGGGIDAIA